MRLLSDERVGGSSRSILKFWDITMISVYESVRANHGPVNILLNMDEFFDSLSVKERYYSKLDVVAYWTPP